MTMTDFVFGGSAEEDDQSSTDLASYSVGVQPEVTPEEEEAWIEKLRDLAGMTT